MTVFEATVAQSPVCSVSGNYAARLLRAFVDIVEPLVGRNVHNRRWIAIELDDEDFAFYRARGKRVEFYGNGRDLDEAKRRALSSRAAAGVELRLRAASVMTTTLQVPAGGRDYVTQIVEHRLDRLTPWKPERLLYGFVARQERDQSGQIDIDFAATSQDIAAAAFRRLGSFGIVPTMLGRAGEAIDRPLSIDLLRGRSDRSRQTRRNRIAWIVLLLPAALAVAAIVTTYLRFDVSQRLATLERDIAIAQRTLVAGTGDTADRQRDLSIIDAKRPQDAMFTLVDRLATITPTTTYLDGLEVGFDSIHMTGRSTEASALIEIFEAEPLLEEARFSAPVTRESDGRDRFDISIARSKRPERSP